MMNDNLDSKAIEAVRGLAEKAAGNLVSIELAPPTDTAGLPEKVPAFVRTGGAPQIVSARDELEKWRILPERRKGVAKVTNLESFIDLVNRHKDEDSAIFGVTDQSAPKLVAVIDYHQQDKTPRWGQHRIEYAFPLSDEWKSWRANNLDPMGQGEFATWLEDRISELAAPYDDEREELEKLFKTKIGTPAEIIEVSRGLEINVSSRIKSAVTLQTGERELIFTEEHGGASGQTLTVPGLFIIAVAPFVDGEPIRVPARLRYRRKPERLEWHYDMYRPDYWLRLQIKKDLSVAAGETGLPAYEGAPEA